MARQTKWKCATCMMINTYIKMQAAPDAFRSLWNHEVLISRRGAPPAQHKLWRQNLENFYQNRETGLFQPPFSAPTFLTLENFRKVFWLMKFEISVQNDRWYFVCAVFLVANNFYWRSSLILACNFDCVRPNYAINSSKALKIFSKREVRKSKF